MTFPPLTIGSVIALVVLLLGILGMLGVLPFSAVIVFGMLSALAVARLCQMIQQLWRGVALAAFGIASAWLIAKNLKVDKRK